MTDARATEIGTLYIVATPIGNRDDISIRALQTLKTVDLILAEDTRHSQPLLHALGIKNTLYSLHAHNEHEKSKIYIQSLLEGQSLAIISDAGTPLISDPGYILVRLAHEHQIPVVPIPGACALITALCAAGVPCDSFLFLGFLPAKKNARQKKLLPLSQEPHTLIFYESTHRILECLEDLQEIFGPTIELVVAKELTKSFERFVRGSVLELLTWLKADLNHMKGEFVVIIPPRPLLENQSAQEKLLSVLLEELPLKQAVALATKIEGGNKNELYQLALKLKK